MKPPVWRTDASLYPHGCQLQTRYADEDQLGHVNNIAIAGYFDEVRARFSRQLFSRLEGGQPPRIVTADSRVSYLAEVFHRDLVEVRTGILRIGSASYDLGQALFQDGKCAALCTTTFVQATREGASPLAPALRDLLGEMLITAPEA